MSKTLRPSEYDAKYKAYTKKHGIKEDQKKLIDEIPDDEKWRLIRESGLLDKIKKSEKKNEYEGIDFTKPPPDDFIFDAIFYSIPFSTLYVIMMLLVHRQYNEDVGLKDLAFIFIKAFPAILFWIYATNKHRHNRFIKVALLLIGITCGVKLMSLMVGQRTMGEMRASAGLATLWSYSIFQLDFLPCLVGVIVPALYYFYLL